MTLQNGLTHGRKAYLWCDTAYWDYSTGDLAYHAPKAFQGKSWPFAGSFSTWGGDCLAIAEHIGNSHPKDLGELLDVTVDAMRWFAKTGGDGRILLASYHNGPHLHVIPCHEIFPGYAAFEPVEIDHFVCSANQSDAYKMAARLGMTPKRMRRVIDAQCVTPFAGHANLAGLGDRVWIAGNVVRLEVSAAGVTSAIERAV